MNTYPQENMKTCILCCARKLCIMNYIHNSVNWFTKRRMAENSCNLTNMALVACRIS